MHLNIHLTRQSDDDWALKIKCVDEETFAATLAAFKAAIPSLHRKFDFVQRCWVINGGGNEHLERYLAAMRNLYKADVSFDTQVPPGGERTTADEAEKTNEASQTNPHQKKHHRQERHRGHRPRDLAPAIEILIAEAYDTLYLRPGAPLPLVRAAYRALAKMYHPDAGGDTRKMSEINNAYHLLTAECTERAA